MMARRILMSVCVAAVLGGCQKAVLTARHSINPVLLGPVSHLGGAARERSMQGEVVALFDTEGGESFWFSSSTSSTGTTSHGYREQAAASQTDWAVLVTTNGQPHRTIHLESVRCGSFAFFFPLGAVANETWCKAAGSVYDPPRPTQSQQARTEPRS